MAETWTILALEIVGGAKRARVQHRRPPDRWRAGPDGSVVIREYSWPAAITKDQLIRTLDDLHAKLLAEPPAPAGYDEAMDLVGTPREA